MHCFGFDIDVDLTSRQLPGGVMLAPTEVEYDSTNQWFILDFGRLLPAGLASLHMNYNGSIVQGSVRAHTRQMPNDSALLTRVFRPHQAVGFFNSPGNFDRE